jgi:biotin-dependent carboxylase-like uncharacterized protein
MSFDVIDGGLATTIQDRGRLEWSHLGVPRSGAADPRSLAIANRLVGNDPGAAALEMTLVGPTLIARQSIVIALAGADLGGRVVGGRRLPVGRCHRIDAGETIAFPGDTVDRRARACLAMPGGIDVPEMLGSRSTCLAAAFGGLDGRTVREGDVIELGGSRASIADAIDVDQRVWPGDPEDSAGDALLRVLPGPASGVEAIADGSWRVGREADRVGIRLDGDRLLDALGGEVVSHGMVWGAVQVPPDGRPIVLGPDHHTTGGYRAIAVVISADRGPLGQLRPGANVAFQIVTRPEAVAAVYAQEAELIAAVAAMRDGARWDELARSAGA